MSINHHSSQPRPNNWAARGPTDKQRTRGRRWMAIRARILERDGYACTMPHPMPVKADIVDHRVPIAKGGTDDDGNLRSLCRACSDKVTREQFGWKAAKPTISVDGWPITN